MHRKIRIYRSGSLAEGVAAEIAATAAAAVTAAAAATVAAKYSVWHFQP